MAASAAAGVLGVLCNAFNATANPQLYGKLIFYGDSVGYVGSIFAFWKATKAYKKFKERRRARKKLQTE